MNRSSVDGQIEIGEGTEASPEASAHDPDRLASGNDSVEQHAPSGTAGANLYPRIVSGGSEAHTDWLRRWRLLV